MKQQPLSTEVSEYTVCAHIREHGFFLDVDEVTLKSLNILLDIQCCDKNSIIVCVLCSEILLVRLEVANELCECLKELFDE